MATTLTEAARNAATNAVVDLLDVGSADATGDIAFYTAGLAILLATCALTNPAFGNAAVGVATAAAISQGVVAGSANPSTIALALFRNRDNAEVFRCAVAVSGSDINATSVTVNDGDTIDVSSLTYTQPA